MDEKEKLIQESRDICQQIRELNKRQSEISERFWEIDKEEAGRWKKQEDILSAFAT